MNEPAPLTMTHELIDGIYQFASEDGRTVFTMDPETKQYVLSWHQSDDPLALHHAATSFFRGFEKHINPIIESNREEGVSEEVRRYVRDMELAWREIEGMFEPLPGTIH